MSTNSTVDMTISAFDTRETPLRPAAVVEGRQLPGPGGIIMVCHVCSFGASWARLDWV